MRKSTLTIGVIMALFLMALSPLVMAQEESPDSEKDDEMADLVNVLTGVVIDADTSSPLVEASLSLYELTGDYYFKERIFTDEEGIYEVDVPNGTIVIEVWMDGYESTRSEITISGPKTVYLNFSLEPIVLTLVQGYITDRETEDPIEGAQLSFYRGDRYYGNDDVYEEGGTDSSETPPRDPEEDEEDRRQDEERPESDEGDEAPPESDEGYITYYESDITDENGYFEVELSTGDYQVNVNYVGKHLEDSSGSPPSDEPTEDVENTRRIPLDDAEYYGLYDTLEVTEDIEVMWYNLTLKPLPAPSATVKGYVKDADTGEAVTDIYLYISGGMDDYDYDREEPALAGAEDSKTRSDPQDWDESYWDYYDIEVDETGFYEQMLRPGTYTISFNSGNYGMVYEERMDSQSSTSVAVASDSSSPGSSDEPEFKPFYQEFEVEEEEVKELDIELTPLPPIDAEIKGKITDSDSDEPVEGLYLSVSGTNDDWYDHFSGTTDSSGNYEIKVRAGTYWVETGGTYYYYDYRGEDVSPGTSDENSYDKGVPEPAFQGKQYFPFNKIVTVGAGSSVKLDIEVTPYPDEDAEISGTVIDAQTEEPLQYVSIQVMVVLDAGTYNKWASTDGDGEYSVSVPESTVRLEFTHEDWYYYDYDDDWDDDDDWEDEEASTDSDEEPSPKDTRAEEENSVDSEPAPPPEDSEPAEPTKDSDEPPDRKDTVTRYFPMAVIKEIDADQKLTLDIEMDAIPTEEVTIKGTVTDGDDPVPYAYVTVVDMLHYTNEYSGSTIADEDGEYSITTHPSVYLVTTDIGMYGMADGRAPAVKKVDVSDGKDETVDLSLNSETPDVYTITITFDTMDSGTLEMNVDYRENTLQMRMIIDGSYGNGDREVTQAEIDLFSKAMDSFDDMITVTVDGIPLQSVGTEDWEIKGALGSIDSDGTMSIGVTTKMELAGTLSSGDDHKIGLDIPDYIPGTLNYMMILPDEQVIEDTRNFEPLDIDDYRNVWDESTGGSAPADGEDSESGQGKDSDSLFDPIFSDSERENLSFDVTVDPTKVKEQGDSDDDVSLLIPVILVLVVVAIIAMLLVAQRSSKRKDSDKKDPQ